MSSLHDIVIIMDNRSQITAVVIKDFMTEVLDFVLILSLKLCIMFPSKNQFIMKKAELFIHLSIHSC